MEKSSKNSSGKSIYQNFGKENGYTSALEMMNLRWLWESGKFQDIPIYKGLELRRQVRDGDIIETIDDKALDMDKIFQGQYVDTGKGQDKRMENI